MKKETRRRLDDLPMGKLMLVISLIGLVAIPVLWTQGHLTSAVATMLFVAMLVLQAALIDLPGLTYTQINKMWSKGPRKDGEPPPADPGVKPR